MSAPPLILVVDDDAHLREVVRYALEGAGFRVEEAADGAAALRAADALRPALVVLDVLMPELDGLGVCRTLRARGRTPIVFVSSRDDEFDRVLGLELGGDDYVPKPFSPRELVARVRAVLRRSEGPGALGIDPAAPAPGATNPAAPAPAATNPVAAGHDPAATAARGTLRRGALTLDLDAWRAFLGDREVVLTVTELTLLATLVRAPTRAFTRDELMTRVYADVVVTERTIDSHVRRLRAKFAPLGADPIETVHGLGYRLGAV